MKKLKKDILDLTKGGIIIGVGAEVTSKAGLAASGLGEIGRFYPIMGKLAGAGATVRILERLGKKRRRKKR